MPVSDALKVRFGGFRVWGLMPVSDTSWAAHVCTLHALQVGHSTTTGSAYRCNQGATGEGRCHSVKPVVEPAVQRYSTAALQVYEEGHEVVNVYSARVHYFFCEERT